MHMARGKTKGLDNREKKVKRYASSEEWSSPCVCVSHGSAQDDVNSQIGSLCHVNLCRKNYLSYQILNMQVNKVLVIVAVIA